MRLSLVAALLSAPVILPMAAAAQPPSAQAACAPMPRLELEPGFADPRRLFGPESPGMSATRTNFEIAYRRACQDGTLRRVAHLGGPDDVLQLRNSPQANIASILHVSINRRRGAEGRVLEYFFVTDDGELHVPSAEEIHEAIYCRATSASTSEREDGRCLPD